MLRGDEVYREGILAGLKPDPIFTVSEWADRFRTLSRTSSAEPGRWRTDRTPYLREIMDSLSVHDPVQTVVFMKGSQIGGSEAGNNWLGYIIDHAPGPVMAVQPNLELAKRYSKGRIKNLIESTPSLRSRVKEAKSRDSGNTISQKEFEGGLLVIAGANSAVGLRSIPARFLFLDEIDGYPIDVDGEGDPISLAEARSRTFNRRKIFKVSTPTIEGRSRIQKAYENSDQRRFFVPCPHCEEIQTIEWKNIKWPPGEPEKAILICEHCGAEIQEHQKTKMFDKGKWVSTNPNHRNKKVVGYHLSSLYSPVGWRSWGDIALDFEEAKKDPAKLRTFVNTDLGETWKEKGEAPEWKKLWNQRESYEFNKVPPGGLFITAGVDVQKDRLEYEIVAWGRDKQSWSIDYRIIHGDTSTDAPFLELDKVLNDQFPVEGNEKVTLPIRMLGIDSGYNTQMVYNWSRKHSITRVIATKGSDSSQLIIGSPKVVDVNLKGKRIARGAKLWTIGASVAKSELYSWLNFEKPTEENAAFPAGYCHFPEYEENYFKMLTAEQIVKRVVGGKARYIWEKHFERNEALDCRIIARAAASVVGLDRFKDENWKELQAQISKKEENDSKAVDKDSKNGEISRKKSSFWG